jgi:hypothetical protein
LLFEELYRYVIDDFVIKYCQEIKKKDFTVKADNLSRRRLGKREYLNDAETNGLMRKS